MIPIIRHPQILSQLLDSQLISCRYSLWKLLKVLKAERSALIYMEIVFLFSVLQVHLVNYFSSGTSVNGMIAKNTILIKANHFMAEINRRFGKICIRDSLNVGSFALDTVSGLNLGSITVTTTSGVMVNLSIFAPLKSSNLGCAIGPDVEAIAGITLAAINNSVVVANPSWILCGNGSEDTLHLLARTYATEGDEIIFAESAFGLYQIATLAVGAKPVLVPRENFKLNWKAVFQKVTPQTKIIYLDHPGNPVGNFLNKDDLLKLIQETPSTVLIVLDAAYAEYLEGLRLGWIYANPKILEPVNRIRPPFNVTSLTQNAGIEALKDQTWVKKAMDHNAIWRPCMVNFGDKATDVYQFLGENGIIVRPMGAYNLPSYLRITIGQAHEMQELGHAKTKQDLEEAANDMQTQYNFRYALPDLLKETMLISPEENETWIMKFPVLS
eukprot:gene17697-17907_t